MNDRHDPADGTTVREDDRLLARLGKMFRDADPPPADVLELARWSFSLRALDAELAALVEDLDAAQFLVPVRGTGTADLPRQLAFQTDDLIILVEVEIAGRGRRLTGQLQPAGPADIELYQPRDAGSHTVPVDHLGRFIIDDIRPGPTRLMCRRAGLPPVATAWTIV